jgi:hypothetical protein
MIHFGLIHATFREVPTMPRTIASMHAAGIEQVTVFPDSGVWGAFRNLDRALTYLVGIAGPSDHVCVADDDMIVHPDALVHLSWTLKANPEVPHTLYTIGHSVRHLPEDAHGWVEIKPNWGDTWGGWVVMSRAVAAEVIAHPFWKRYRQTDKVGKHCDVALYETLRHLGYIVRAHIPSLTDDISEGSTTIGTTNKEAVKGYKYDQWEQPTP